MNGRTLALVTTLLSVVSAAAQEKTVNDEIVKYCKDHKGQKVGDGECASLAEAALKYAKAKPLTAFKDFPNKEDYVWGELVYALEIKEKTQKETKVPEMAIQAGDIIQFRDARFEGKKLRGFDKYEASYPHHTAVVLTPKGNNVVSVLEQNVDGKREVVETSYRLTDLKAGWLRIYRPVSE